MASGVSDGDDKAMLIVSKRVESCIQAKDKIYVTPLKVVDTYLSPDLSTNICFDANDPSFAAIL